MVSFDGLFLLIETYSIIGIGIETARSLALAGAHVICLNRNEELSVKAISKVKNEKVRQRPIPENKSHLVLGRNVLHQV